MGQLELLCLYGGSGGVAAGMLLSVGLLAARAWGARRARQQRALEQRRVEFALLSSPLHFGMENPLGGGQPGGGTRFDRLEAPIIKKGVKGNYRC